MRALIAGCGYLGTALGLRLIQAGYEVWGLRRDPSKLPQQIHPLGADLSAPNTPLELPVAFNHVVYSVGPDQRSADAYRAAYSTGFARLAEALRRQPSPTRVLFTSSTGVYGCDDGSWVDETTPPEPRGETAAILLAAERQALGSGLPVTILRLAGIYGPGRRRLIDRVRTGAALCRDGPPRYSNRIHRDDAVAALLHLLTLPSPADLYLVADDEPTDQCQVFEWLAARMSVPPPAHAVAAASDNDSTNKRCRNDRLTHTGWAPAFPTFREGYSDVLSGLGLLLNPDRSVAAGP